MPESSPSKSSPPPVFTVGTHVLLMLGALIVYAWVQSAKRVGGWLPGLGEAIIGCAVLLLIGTVGPIIALVRRERGRFWTLPVLVVCAMCLLFAASRLLR